VRAIADTGLLVAFANRRDRHHAWAVELAEKATEAFLTCEPVLAEAAFHLRSVTLVLAMVNEGLLRLDFDVASHLDRVAQLARKYEDRRPDLADLCLIRMSELHPRHSVVTVDAGFLVYRRNGREAIPVIMPSRS
jgi:predicted nucleic acid-binding protein